MKKLSEKDFRSAIIKAQTMIDVGERPDYWRGFQRGARRAYHGEVFGTEQEHAQWLSLVDSDDSTRVELGQGYRDGLGLTTTDTQYELLIDGQAQTVAHGDVVHVGQGPGEEHVTMYHPDGPALCTVVVHGDMIPALVLRPLHVNGDIFEGITTRGDLRFHSDGPGIYKVFKRRDASWIYDRTVAPLEGQSLAECYWRSVED